jgi:hypothetical protein
MGFDPLAIIFGLSIDNLIHDYHEAYQKNFDNNKKI